MSSNGGERARNGRSFMALCTQKEGTRPMVGENSITLPNRKPVETPTMQRRSGSKHQCFSQAREYFWRYLFLETTTNEAMGRTRFNWLLHPFFRQAAAVLANGDASSTTMLRKGVSLVNLRPLLLCEQHSLSRAKRRVR